MLIAALRHTSLVVAPVLLLIASFIIFARLIERLGLSYSRFSPNLCKTPLENSRMILTSFLDSIAFSAVVRIYSSLCDLSSCTQQAFVALIIQSIGTILVANNQSSVRQLYIIRSINPQTFLGRESHIRCHGHPSGLVSLPVPSASTD